MCPPEPYTDPILSDDIQQIILSTRVGLIAANLSERLHLSPAEALYRFYDSRTYAMMCDKSTGLYLYSELYIADEYLLEQEANRTA